MHKIFRGLIACLVAGIFTINSITLAGEINLAAGTRILDVLREARLYYSVIALHSELVSKNINNLRGLYLEMDRIINGLVSAEKVNRDDIDKLKCLVFDSINGDKVYYYFREDGLFFRVAKSPDTKDRYSNVLGLGEPVERREIEIMAEDSRRGEGQEYYLETNYLEIYRLDTERMDYIKKCLSILYPEGLEDEPVEEAINDITFKKPPEWIAQDYRAGYLLIKDMPETGLDSKNEIIEDAMNHLYRATSDPIVRKRVESLLDILRNHPKGDSLTIIQYRGIAHRLVKEHSGNPDAYKEYKEGLDKSFNEIYGAIRDEISRITDDKERLRLAMLYAGIGNLMDLTFPDVLRRISDDLGIDVEDHLGLVKGVYKKIIADGLIIEGDDFEKFFSNIKRTPDGLILYFLDNHGEVILDQLVIEELLKSGYRVAVVARGETARDDVTVDEAGEILGRNSYLREYLESGRLSIVTDGSYLIGADLSQSGKHPEFLKAWQGSISYIAKGAANFHTLLGQRLSIPGLHIRMMKGSRMPYKRLSQLKGRPISKKSDYDLAFIYQYAPLFNPKKLDGVVLPDGTRIKVYADRSDYPPEVLKHWDNHYAVFEITNSELGYTAYMAIHRLTRIVSKCEKINGQWRATGETRIRNYKSNTDALADALELSQEMSFKCAGQLLAIGGSKCTINAEKKREILISYAKAIEEIGHRIGGGVLTGQDVKITKGDADLMSEHAPTSIIPNVAPDICREPAPPTGIGVVAAIKSAVAETFPDAPDVSGKVVAVQGAGGTGASVIKKLLGLGAIVIASDINKDAIDVLRKELTGEDRDRFYYIVEEKIGDGYTRHIMNPRAVRSFTDTLLHIDAIGQVDVFSPCAIGPVLNPETIGELQKAGVKVVCGSCNNVLEDKTRNARLLMEQGITFVPDYIANAGDVIGVDGHLGHDISDIGIAERIGSRVRDIIRQSKATGKTTQEIADTESHEFFEKLEIARRIIPDEISQGSHIVRKARDGVEALLYRTGLEVVRGSVSITEPMSRGWYTGLYEYAGLLRNGLKRLLDIYGTGIFTQVNEIQIVENLGAGDVYPDGRAPLASYTDGILKIDELAFRYGEHLLFEELEHEFLESIAVLIPGATHALADVVSTFMNVKRFLELGTDEKERFLEFLGDENPIDPDGEYLALLRRLSEISDVSDNEIIASVVRYVLKTKLYERVRGELGLPEELAGRIRDLKPRFDDALAVFNEIAKAKEGRGLVDNVKSTGRLAIRVIETLRGIRISITEAQQEVIETTILSLYPHEISWVREHSKRVAKIAEIIAERMQLGTELVRLIRIAALAHDLGKGSSREMIDAVNSPGPKISEIIDRHREESLRMLEVAGIDMDEVVRQAILYHHDPWLTTDKYARIATEIIYLADQVDASQDVHRPYKKRPIDITLLLLEFRRHYKTGKISKPVYKAAYQLLTGTQHDFIDVIYDARGEKGISEEEMLRRLSGLFNSLLNYKPQEQVLSLKWDEEINAVDLYYFYRYISGLEGLGEGGRRDLIMRLLLAIVSSSLDIKGYDAMKPFSYLILFDRMGSDAMRSHAREFRNNFDPSGEKSREIINLVSKIQDRVSGEMRQFVDDFKKRCGLLLIGRLLDYLKGYDNLSLPETPDIARPRYIVVSGDREKVGLEDILQDRYDIHVVTEIPKDGEFVVLVNPEDVGKWEGQDLLYLPLPYMEQSLKLAAGMLLSGHETAHDYVKGFYNILLGRNLSDEEVANLFHRPWWILPEISALAADLIILREAISQLEKSA